MRADPCRKEFVQQVDLALRRDRLATDEGRIYGIWVDGTLMGGTPLSSVRHQDGLGVWLDPTVVGRGLVTRAAKHMIDWAVCVRGMSRVEWCALPANERSIAVAQRLGMPKDGVLRPAFEINGARHDLGVWSVLKAEWPTGN